MSTKTFNYVKFLWGTPEDYASLLVKNSDTLYFVTEEDSNSGSLYWGDKLITDNIDTLNELSDVILNDVIDDGALLVYDKAQSAWVSKNVSDAIATMLGASDTKAGVGGLVPAPGVGEQNYFLRGDGVWAIPEAEAIFSTDKKSIVVNDSVIGLRDFGVRYYKYVAKNEIAEAHYVEQEVNELNPWKAGLEAKVVSRDGELVLGWFEPKPIAVEELKDGIANIQTVITNIEQIIGSPATETEPATGLYAKADADAVYTKKETDDKIAAAIVAADHLKRKTFSSFEEAETFAIMADDPSKYVYMVLVETLEGDNKYREYLYVDGVLEKVGSWDIDLSDYATKEEVKVEIEGLSTRINDNKSSIEVVKTSIKNVADALNNYVTIATYEAEIAEIKECVEWHKL